MSTYLFSRTALSLSHNQHGPSAREMHTEVVLRCESNCSGHSALREAWSLALGSQAQSQCDAASYDKRSFHSCAQTRSNCRKRTLVGTAFVRPRSSRDRLCLITLGLDLAGPVSRIMASSTSIITVFVVTADVRSERRVDLHTTVGQLKVRAVLPIPSFLYPRTRIRRF